MKLIKICIENMRKKDAQKDVHFKSTVNLL